MRGANKTKLAATHGISRRWIYFLIDEAEADAEGKFEEAEKEADFRRQVTKILDGQKAR